MNDDEFLAEKVWAADPVRLRRGVYIGLNTDLMAIVDMGDSRFFCGWGAGFIPEVNEPVQVLTIGMQNLIFPLKAKPGEGTAMSTPGASPRVTVQTAIGDISMPYVGTPSSGNRLAIGWSEGPRALGVLSASSDSSLPDADPTPPSPVKTVTFRATHAGSTDRHQARWWSPNPQAGDSSYGAWFYGSAPDGTIPAGATFVGLQIKINRTKDFGGKPRWVLHDGLYPVNTGLPTFSSPYTEWDPPNGWQTPPMALTWFNALKGGGAWQGVGLNQGGHNIFASLAQDSESGALRISWR